MTGVVVMTMAVTPSIGLAVSVADPTQRLNQYRSALEKWIRVAERRDLYLAVVETTGFAEDRLLGQKSDHIIYHNHEPSTVDVSRGKGAIEAAALDSVMAVLPSPITWGIKVTGRLFVTNSEVFFNPGASAVRVRRTLDRAYADSRAFTFDRSAWQSHLNGMNLEVDEARGRYLEHVLAMRLIAGEYAQTLRVDPFVRRPVIVGQSGTTGRKYGSRTQQWAWAAMDRVEPSLLNLARKQV